MGYFVQVVMWADSDESHEQVQNTSLEWIILIMIRFENDAPQTCTWYFFFFAPSLIGSINDKRPRAYHSLTNHYYSLGSSHCVKEILACSSSTPILDGAFHYTIKKQNKAKNKTNKAKTKQYKAKNKTNKKACVNGFKSSIMEILFCFVLFCLFVCLFVLLIFFKQDQQTCYFTHLLALLKCNNINTWNGKNIMKH